MFKTNPNIITVPRTDALNEFLGQKDLKVSTNKTGKLFNDPFLYIDRVKPGIRSIKRTGQYNTSTGVEKSSETLVYPENFDFIADTRTFATDTIDGQYINPTSRQQRLPYHDLDANNLDTTKKVFDNLYTILVPTDLNLPFDDKDQVKDIDDLFEEVPSIHPENKGMKTIF